MHFRIAYTFTDILAELSGNEHKAAKNTVFDLHTNPAQPGLRKHRLDDYNGRRFFVNDAYFLGTRDPCKALKSTLKAEINREARETLYSETYRPFEKPKLVRIAVKVINHLGDEVMKMFWAKFWRMGMSRK